VGIKPSLTLVRKSALISFSIFFAYILTFNFNFIFRHFLTAPVQDTHFPRTTLPFPKGAKGVFSLQKERACLQIVQTCLFGLSWAHASCT
jgi:hypothetical protein